MTLLHVVQQVLNTLGNALAFGVDGLLLGLGIESHEVAGRTGIDPLLHRKAHTCLRLGFAFHRLGQRHQRLGVDEIQRC